MSNSPASRLQEGLQAALELAQQEGHLELRPLAPAGEAAPGEAGGVEAELGDVLEDERRLEQGRLAQGALRLHLLHQLLERQVLVGERLQRRPPGAGQGLAEGRVLRQVRAQHEVVDEEADQPFGLGPVAAGDVGPDAKVALARVAGEQRAVGDQHGHEEGRPLAPVQVLHRGHQAVVEIGEGPAGELGLEARARAVRGQLQGGHAGQPLAPVAELLFEHVALQPVALPGGEVGVLHRQLGQGPPGGNLASVQEGRVQRAQLAQHDADRPAVRGDVVDVEQQGVLVRREPHEAGAHHRAAREVERRPGVAGDQLLGLAQLRGLRQRGQVDERQRDRGRRRDRLRRPAGQRGEARAQRLVAARELGQAAGQDAGLELAVDPQPERDVVGGVARLELVEEPEPLLGERQG